MWSDDITRVVFEVLQSRRSVVSKTVGFEALGHNRDLCPLLRQRLDESLRSVERHMSVAYDTQSLSDHGIDVLVRLEDQPEIRFIGFQVKADNEFRKQGIHTLLKAQHFDAFDYYGDDLLRYFILPCVNYSDEARHDAVRRICSDFAKAERTTVVEPPFIWNFLYETSSVALEALTSAFISDDDPLHREAVLSVAQYSPTQRKTLLRVVAQHIAEPESPLTLNELSIARGADSVAEPSDWWVDLELPERFQFPPELSADQGPEDFDFASDIDALEGQIDVDENGNLTLERDGLEALIAYGYDGWARYDHSGEDLVEYLQRLLVTPLSDSEWNVEAVADLVLLAKRISPRNAVAPMAVLCKQNFSEPRDVLELLGLPGEDDETWTTAARTAVRKLRTYWD